MDAEKEALRQELKEKYGDVWDTTQLQEEFEVLGFAFYLCIVKRKSDGRRGTLAFSHMPRLYYHFVAEYV